MVALACALALLAALGLVGVVLLLRWLPFLDPLERFAYGVPLGATVGSLALLAAGSVAGHLSSFLVASVGGTCVAIAVALERGRGARSGTATRGRVAWVRAVPLFPAVVLGLLVVRWLIFWASAITVEGDGLYVGSRSLYGDFAQHLGDVTAFAYGDNFPPQHPRFAGAPFGYHYLTSVTSAALVALGLDAPAALTLPGFLFCCSAALAVYAFARRLSGQPTVAALAVLLFFVGGGLGWWAMLEHAAAAPSPLRSLLATPWDADVQAAANYRWLNVFFALVAPQRGYLYGLPLGLLTLRVLFEGVTDRRAPRFVAAGLVASLLPFAHLGTLLVLALVTPLLWAAHPQRHWLWFFGTWVLVALPQLWLQQGPGAGPLAALRWAPGWVAAPDPWIVFWVLNWGVLLPLAIAALAVPGGLAGPSRRFLAALLGLFIAANLVTFQPWDWDNTKVLVYAYLAACILGASALVRAWRRQAALRVAVAIGLATLLASGLLENVSQALGREHHRLLSAEEVALAELVRADTPPRALFVCGLQHNHPVPVLAGRRVLLSYPGWHWSQGLDISDRKREVQTIYALGADTDTILARHGVSYVVVGPWEREHLGADLTRFRARFPRALGTESYEVFDVRGVSARSGATSARRTPSP